MEWAVPEFPSKEIERRTKEKMMYKISREVYDRVVDNHRDTYASSFAEASRHVTSILRDLNIEVEKPSVADARLMSASKELAEAVVAWLESFPSGWETPECRRIINVLEKAGVDVQKYRG